MYSREYLFVRRIIVDTENQQLVLMSRGVEHPKCPETKEFVRVKSYKSNLILKPHTSVDEVNVPKIRYHCFLLSLVCSLAHYELSSFFGFFQNGFDYMLTYCDDPQAAIPSVAYSWIASSGETQ